MIQCSVLPLLTNLSPSSEKYGRCRHDHGLEEGLALQGGVPKGCLVISYMTNRLRICKSGSLRL